MQKKKIKTEYSFSSTFDQKIINLTILFFGLSVVLFITGIFKLNNLTDSMPFSQSRDYVIFEKDTTLGATCGSEKPCTDLLKVYRSGKVIGLGSKMFIDVLTTKQLNNLLATINKTDILNKDCPENPEGVSTQSYTIKLGVQVKRANSDACSTELSQIEAQIFQ